MRFLLSAVAMVGLSGPLFACINDTELRSHEREFKSQYQESSYTPPEPEQATSSKPFVLSGLGVAMGLAGVGLFLRLRSR
jgi:hypothetical protein